MKLIAKAKPVRIRITSGGEEHATLDSLRKNFVWKDIRELFDGRLIKWLRRIDENDKAQQISEIKNPDLNILNIFNILFPQSYQFKSLEDVLLSYENDASLFDLSSELIKQEPMGKVLGFLGNERFNRSQEIIMAFLEGYSIESHNKIEPKSLYEVGKKLFTYEDSKNLGRKLIENAAKGGYYDAQKFINQHTNVFRKGYADITHILSLESTRNIITTSWGNSKRISLNSFTHPLKEIFEFSNICLNLYISGNNYYWADIERMINIHLLNIPKDDILFDEKQFVAALFINTNKEEQNKILKNLKDYGPAQKLIKSKTINLNGCVFSKDSFYQNIKNLDKYLSNLYQFRNE